MTRDSVRIKTVPLGLVHVDMVFLENVLFQPLISLIRSPDMHLALPPQGRGLLPGQAVPWRSATYHRLLSLVGCRCLRLRGNSTCLGFAVTCPGRKGRNCCPVYLVGERIWMAGQNMGK